MQKSRFLDAEVDLVHIRDEGDESIYSLRLGFVDPLGRQRKHMETVVLPGSLVTTHRVSFTAMSSVNLRTGIVEKVSDLKINIMLFNGSKIVVDNHHDQDLMMGQAVCIIEHFDVMSTDRNLSLVVLPHPLPISSDMLCLQSVNADILNEAGEMIYRMSADPFRVRGCYGSRLEN